MVFSTAVAAAFSAQPIATGSTGNSESSSVGFWILFGLAVVFFVLVARLRALYNKDIKEQVAKNFKSEGFTPSEYSQIGSRVLAIDKDSRRIAIHTGTTKEPTKFFSAAQIMSVSVYEGGHVVSQVNRGGQIAAAAVGGAVFGKTGALIGAIGSKSVQQEQIRDITVRLELDDSSCPIYDHRIFNGEFKKDGWLYRQESQKARSISSQISSLIRATTADISNKDLSSVSAEIVKLAELHASGALSSDEFAEAKQRVLRRDSK